MSVNVCYFLLYIRITILQTLCSLCNKIIHKKIECNFSRNNYLLEVFFSQFFCTKTLTRQKAQKLQRSGCDNKIKKKKQQKITTNGTVEWFAHTINRKNLSFLSKLSFIFYQKITQFINDNRFLFIKNSFPTPTDPTHNSVFRSVKILILLDLFSMQFQQ